MTGCIQRKTELFLVGKLKSLVPECKHVPYAGGSLNEDADSLEPPFSVTSASGAENVLQNESTWKITGSTQVLAHASEMSSHVHSELAAKVYGLLKNLDPDWSDPTFAFHGIDITGQREATDEDSKCHATIIDWVAGTGG